MRKYKYLIHFIILLFVGLTFELSAQVGINNSTNRISGSAMLDISSTDKGLLIPRIPTASRNMIPSPAAGLLIYNTTTNHFDYYNGTFWLQIESSFVSANTGSLSPGGGVSVSTVLDRLPDNSAMLDASDPMRGFFTLVLFSWKLNLGQAAGFLRHDFFSPLPGIYFRHVLMVVLSAFY